MYLGASAAHLDPHKTQDDSQCGSYRKQIPSEHLAGQLLVAVQCWHQNVTAFCYEVG